jgi:hypothetical protein
MDETSWSAVGGNTLEISSYLNVVGYTDVAANQLASKGLTRASTALKSFAPQMAVAVSGFIHFRYRKCDEPGVRPAVGTA